MKTGGIKTILTVAAAGVFAVFADQVLWPYFVEAPLFYKYKLDQNQIYVTEKQLTTIQENKALKSAVEKVAKTVVGVSSTGAKGAVIEESGLILSSDGLVATLSSLMPANGTAEIFIEGQKTAYRVIKRDKASDLALVKVEQTNLPTSSFYLMDGLVLGERVFLYGNSPSKKIVNEGVIRSIGADLIETTIIDNAEAAGSPVFDIEGNILGLSVAAKDGRISILSVAKIKELSGL
jgi:S1-C subfamily serine protease